MLLPIMKILDWIFSGFLQRKKSNNTHINTGKRCSNQTVEGNVGAYMVSNKTTFYLVK